MIIIIVFGWSFLALWSPRWAGEEGTDCFAVQWSVVCAVA